jgi:NAD(P)-dependent dehydrogenase (short-subunit alcohol dehydrogenase family)
MTNLKYPFNLLDLKNKIVVLTGGMGKLGTEFTDALVKANAKVAIFDIIENPNSRLLKLSKKYPILFFKVDITNEEEVDRCLKKIKKNWGVPTVLISNAGWKASPNDPAGAGRIFTEYPMNLWDEVFNINTKAAAICSKLVGSMMIKNKKKGVIINIVSHYAIVSADQRIYAYRKKIGKKEFFKDPSYGASKAALISLTRDLSTQWAVHGIRTVALALGGVLNPKSDKEFIDNYVQRVPLGRMADPNEYNGIIIFLASDAASYITGTTIVADGGWTAW